MKRTQLLKLSAAGVLGLLLARDPALAQTKMETPKPGGAIEITTIFPEISPLSFDNYDYAYKFNHDTGAVYEQLFAADMSKAKSRGGPFNLLLSAYLPTEFIRGELAEKWEFQQNPLRLRIDLRKGIMFPEKPGVMKAREFVAEDVVYNFKRVASSPKASANLTAFVKDVTAPDRHTVVFELNEFNAEWDFRLGYGYQSAIIPKEVVDAGAADWKKMNGTGPFKLTEYVQGNSVSYEKNKDYWDKETINGVEQKLPYVDKVVNRIIKDEATRIAALRTGKLDIVELMRWQAAETLKKDVPGLKWNKWLAQTGTFLAMRVDTKPFDDIRVRRALNLAVNKEEIVKTFYNGNAELFAYPMHPGWGGYFEPLEKQPASVQELFKFDPKKAKALLTEAGYPNGFTFTTQACTCTPGHLDLLPLIASYLEQVGVKLVIQPMESAAYFSTMAKGTNAAGYIIESGHGNPTTTIRKNFVTGQVGNMGHWSDPKFDARMDVVFREQDESKRMAELRVLTTEMLDAAPYIWLPTVYNFTAWWPWVKGYEGEIYAGTLRPGPVYARLWVDQDLKKKMGF